MLLSGENHEVFNNSVFQFSSMTFIYFMIEQEMIINSLQNGKEEMRVCQNDASSFSLYNHRFAIFHRV